MWLLFLFTAMANDAASELELGFGAAVRATADDTFSDRAYTGATPVHGAVGLRRQGARWRHEIEVDLDHTAMRTGPSYDVRWDPDGQWIATGSSPFFRVQAGWAAGVRAVEGPVTLDVGGAWRNRIETRNHDYGFTGVFGYLGVFGIGPWARVAARPGPWTLSAEVDLIGVGWGTRSPYAINDDPYMRAIEDHNGLKTFAMHIGHGRPITALSTQDARVQLRAAHALGERWAVSLSTDLALFHERSPAPVTDLTWTSRLGLATTF
ncbi:MAG: hypothetical protein EP330_01895 [Deltaproteobacteria bacterium]|nr:MAG: hypothetical protein EP330_01895 [Deltaproteobacteria bacterium]